MAGVCRVIGLAVLAGLAFLLSPAWGQTWPQRPVRFIVTLGPGSAIDTGTRLFGERLSARWNRPVVVENRPGGDGIVAIGAFVAAHDDHILLAAPTSSFTAHPYLHDTLPYKVSDLVPIVRTSNTLIAIAVTASLPVNSFAELVAMARAQPGKLNWAGATGALDFSFAGFLKRAGLSMSKVPYRNPVEAANDLGEGRVQVFETSLAIVRPQLDSGKAKLLLMTNKVRAPSAPEVPTAAEAGFPELAFDGLHGFFGPPEMAPAVRERIAADVQAVADQTVAARLLATGQLINIGGPAEFAASVDEQRAKLAEVAEELGLKASQ
jgi:tripartite-type tricarboxylate transporter receptor subunit TctC